MILLAWNLLPSHAASHNLSAYRAARGATISHGQQRLASSLQTVAQMGARPGVSASETGMTRLLRFHDDEIEVYIHTTGIDQADLQALDQHGVRIFRMHHQSGTVYASVPTRSLLTVATLPFVRWMSPPSYGVLRTGSVTSAGDMVMRAADVRTSLGIDGSGVYIGIISDSFIDMQPAVDSGDLPPDVIIVDGRDGSTALGARNEGRALAEIIHDLAPGATLLFHSALPSSMDMIAGIRALTAAGADIIVDDIGFLEEPVFEDGPLAQAVQEAIDNGVVYVTATGNDAMQHYNALYREFDPNDGDLDINLHDFGGGDTTMAVTIAPRRALAVVLQWPNPFDASANTADYDLLLLDAQGADEACAQPGLTGSCSSTNVQLGGNAFPFEVVSVDNNTSSAMTVTVVINRVAGEALPLVLNFSGQLTVLEHNVASQSIFGHPCVHDAVAVGAINVNDPGFDTIEPFSSRGPCEIFVPAFEVRMKPDLAAADGVQTSLAGFRPFFGTSAAVPHVAAVAALLIEAAGGPGALSNTQIVDTMRRAAIDLGPPGVDTVYGHGAVDAVLAVQALPPVEPPLQGGGEGGGGGCNILPSEQRIFAQFLEAFGNILLPIVVIIVRRAWRRWHT